MTFAQAIGVLTAARDVSEADALRREILELKNEVRRLRDIKNEALEQAQQWQRAFVAEKEYARGLERQLHGGHAA